MISPGQVLQPALLQFPDSFLFDVISQEHRLPRDITDPGGFRVLPYDPYCSAVLFRLLNLRLLMGGERFEERLQQSVVAAVAEVISPLTVMRVEGKGDSLLPGYDVNNPNDPMALITLMTL